MYKMCPGRIVKAHSRLKYLDKLSIYRRINGSPNIAFEAVDRSMTVLFSGSFLLFMLQASVCCAVVSVGHRPVNVKRAVIGSKGGWKLSTIFLSCKVFHDWSIIKLGNILYLLDGSIFAVLFGTTSHCFC